MASGSHSNVLSVQRLGYESTHCTKEMCSSHLFLFFYFYFQFRKGFEKEFLVKQNTQGACKSELRYSCHWISFHSYPNSNLLQNWMYKDYDREGTADKDLKFAC